MKILIVEDNAVLAKKISDWLAQAMKMDCL